MTRFTASDVARANAAWLCSCGPCALAAILDLTLDEVRPHFMPAFPGYTNLTRMRRALEAAGRQFRVERCDHPFIEPGREWPSWGLCRIQWHGPWTQPGANPRWAYTHTHWIAAWRAAPAICVFDVNAMEYEDDNGWLPLSDWSACTVPRLTADIKRATGGWHLTHSIEVERR